MPSTTLTAPRRLALEVLGRSTEPVPLAARTDETAPTIGSLVARWVIAQDYAREVVLVDEGRALDITEAGLAAFHRLDRPEEVDPAEKIAETFGPGEDDEAAAAEEDAAAEAESANAFAGIDTASITTTVSGVASRITRPLHHREVITVVAQVEVTALSFPATKAGIARRQVGAILDAFELSGKAGRHLINELKQAHDPSPLPFGAKADAAIVDAVVAGVTDGSGVVVTPGDRAALGLEGAGTVAVIFAGGARCAWPDDFPKDTPRPAAGDVVEVPGAGVEEDVTEVLDMATGQPIVALDETDAGDA
jgi:hypothetical protein